MATKKQAKKTMQRELNKALREKCKKSQHKRSTSQEHELFAELDKQYNKQ